MATIRTRKGKKGTHFQAIVRRAGYPDQRRTFPTKQEAQDWSAELERDIRERKLSPHRLAQRKTLADAVDIYLPRIKGTKNYKDTKRLCTWWKDKLGATSLNEITAIGIDQQLDTLSCSKPTMNRYLGALSGCLSHVSKAPYGWVQGNPCRDVPRRKEGKARERIITPKEWKALIAHVDKLASKKGARIGKQQLPTFLRLAYDTGRRRGELLKLRWIDLDLEEGVMYLLDTKSGDDHVVPISDDMIKVLQKHEKEHRLDGYQYVFRGRFPNRPTAFDELTREVFRELFEPDRKGEMPVLHSVRHTAATELGEAGATEAQIMAVTGHKSSASVHRYVKKTLKAAKTAQQLRGQK